jgi:TM2 domain-containing membrane protein YozV
MLIISFLGGALGIDRFILGDTGIGIGKLLTAGGCGIWALVDLFMIQDAARNKNWELLQMHLY